jgi:uncharacterized protein (TIGR00369 family)
VEDEIAVSEQARAFERVRESLAKQGLMGLLGAQVSEVGEGWCVIEIPYGEKLTQQQGYFHGAIAGAIDDSAGGYVALTRTPEGREVLTVEYKINFRAPAWGQMVDRGELLTAGRRLLVCKAEVVAVSGEGEETPCAALQQTPCDPTVTSSSGCPLP